MACATLKRSLDRDALNQCPSKRRCYNPFEQSSSAAATPSKFHASTPARARHNSAARSMYQLHPATTHNAQLNPFLQANVPSMTTERVVRTLQEEIQRQRARKQLYSTAANKPRMQDAELPGNELTSSSSPQRADSPARTATLFTFEQVQRICERMLKEREDELRQEYNSFLTTKLAEQYDAFVKFTFDQIQSRYQAAPSYLS